MIFPLGGQDRMLTRTDQRVMIAVPCERFDLNFQVLTWLS